MKAHEAIMLLRAFLKDENYQSQIYNDNILLDFLSHAQNNLISQFRLNVHNVKVSFETPELIELPYQIAYIYFLLLNNQTLKYASPSQAIKYSTPCFYHLRGKLYAIKGYKDKGELEICASFLSEPLNTPQDDLNIESIYLQALILQAFSDMLLIDSANYNPQRREYYLQALEKEKARIRGINNTANTKGRFEMKSSI